MPFMPPTFRTARPKAERERENDARRGSARERGYTTKWDKAAKGHLDRDPLCRYCALIGDVTAATAVDHLYPHRTYQGAFWIKALWVSTCDDCHNGFKQRLERRGRLALDDLARQLDLPTLDQAQGGGGGKSPRDYRPGPAP